MIILINYFCCFHLRFSCILFRCFGCSSVIILNFFSINNMFGFVFPFGNSIWNYWISNELKLRWSNCKCYQKSSTSINLHFHMNQKKIVLEQPENWPPNFVLRIKLIFVICRRQNDWKKYRNHIITLYHFCISFFVAKTYMLFITF